MPPLPRSVHRIARGSIARRLFSATVATAVFVHTIAPVAHAVWLPTAGTNAFNLTSNWDGGTIDGAFNQTSTDNQVVTLTASASVASLQFTYGGAFNITLQSNTTTARVLTLTSGITVDTVADGRVVQIGATGAGVRVALGDQIQNFTVGGSDELVIFNSISSAGDGGINKLGTGTLRLEGTSGTFTRGTIIAEGTVAVGANAALGVGPITFQGGRLAASGGVRTLANNLIFAGDGQLGGNGPAALSFALTFSGTVDLGSVTRNLLINNSANFNGAISGAGGLNLTTGTTARTITLGAANTFGGAVTVGGLADLALSGAGSIPDTSAVSLISSSADLNISGITAPSETIGSLSGVAVAGVQLGAKTLIVGADNTNTTYAGTLEGSGGFTKIGTGMQSLTAASTAFTGVTRIEGGTLRITNAAALGANPGTATPALLQIADGTLQAGASITVNPNRGITIGPATGTGASTFHVEATRTLTIESSITNSGTGEGRLIKTGDGTLRLLTSVNTFTGGISILAGTLSFALDSRLGAVPSSATPGLLLINGGTLLSTQSVTLNPNRGISIGTAGAVIEAQTGTLSYGGIIEDASSAGGSLTKAGVGTLALTGANVFTSPLAITAGTLSVSAETAFGGNPSAFSAAQLQLNGGTLVTTSSFSIDDGNRGLTIGASGGTFAPNLDTTLTIANPITGPGSLVKSGPGRVVITSASDYAGPTQVVAGTLEISGQLSGTTALSVNAGGTLLFSGSETNRVPGGGVNLGGRIGFASGETGRSEALGSLTLVGDAVLDFGTGTTNSLLFSGLSSGASLLSVWNWTGSLYAPGEADNLIANATQDRLYINTLLGQGILEQIRFYSDAGTTLLGSGAQIDFNGDLQIVPVPEPTPTAMAGALLAMAALRQSGRSRSRTQASSTRRTT